MWGAGQVGSLVRQDPWSDRIPSIVEQIRELCVYTAEGGRERGQACTQQEENLHTFLVAGEVQLRSNGKL